MKFPIMEVFQAGRQTDSNGETRDWTEKDLDKIVEKFNESNKEVPATLGHVKSGDPAWGWFKRVFREGKKLFAELTEYTDELKTLLDKKMFSNRSIALRPDLSIHHIAFLGAEPPAVKGLAGLKFAEGDEAKFVFSEKMEDETKTLFSQIKELFSNFSSKIEKVEEKINKFQDGGQEMDAKKEKELTDKITDLEGKVSQFTEDLKSERKRADDAEAKLKEHSDAAKTKEYTEFAEKMVEDGLVLPANKDSIIQMQRVLDGQETMDFSEGGETVKMTPLENYRKTMERGPKVMAFGEQFSDGETSEDDIREKKINEYAENKKVTYAQAVKDLATKNPNLFK